MSDMSLQDKTKAIIRAIIVSSPAPLTIVQLDRDFYSQEGRKIPFTTLGYRDLKSFLLSISDVLTWNEQNRTFTPVLKTSTGDAHILELVKGQKQQNKKDRNRSSRSTRHNQQRNSNFNQMPRNQEHPNRFEPGNLLSPPNSLLPLSCLRDALSNVWLNVPNYQAVSNFPNRQGVPNGQIWQGVPNGQIWQGVPNYQNWQGISNGQNWQGISNGQAKPVNKHRNGMANKNSTPQVTSRKVDVEPMAEKNLRDHQSDSKPEEISALPPMDDNDPIRFISSKTINSNYGNFISPAILPQELMNGDIRQICVTEVITFPHFYFQFYETNDTMRGLQENLILRYENEYVDSIRVSQIQVGNVCAAYYAGKWSRAEILELPDKRNRLKIQFVDYGTIDYVSIDLIRYLRKELCEYPRLCHRGTLAFLRPLHKREEKIIIDKFIEMVADKSLLAVISKVDKNKNVSMTLVDTSNPTDDVIINKILMENLPESKFEKELDVLHN